AAGNAHAGGRAADSANRRTVHAARRGDESAFRPAHARALSEPEQKRRHASMSSRARRTRLLSGESETVAMETALPALLVLFDGECNLCNRSVQFILQHDPGKRFHFVSLQSPVARRLLLQAGHRQEDLPDSVVLVEQGRIYTRSTAALRIARQLGGFW